MEPVLALDLDYGLLISSFWR